MTDPESEELISMLARQLESNNTIDNNSTNDFKLIRGIGPAIEVKLHDAGISTFTQLAEMSPAELASLFPDFTLLSEDRITKQDWVGQARLLADQYPTEPVIDEEVLLQDGQHYAVFNVELLLDRMNTVRRTRVKHVQSQQENMWDKWSGWDDRRLIEYFTGKAGLLLAPSESTPVGTELKAETVQAREEFGKVNMPGQLRFKHLEAIPSGFDRHSMTVSQDQPVDIYLTLGLSGVDEMLQPRINYAVTVYSKNLSNGFMYLVGEAQGSVEKPDEFNVVIKSSLLPAGAHRLEAIAMVSPLSDDARAHPSHMAMLEGRIIKVY